MQSYILHNRLNFRLNHSHSLKAYLSWPNPREKKNPKPQIREPEVIQPYRLSLRKEPELPVFSLLSVLLPSEKGTECPWVFFSSIFSRKRREGAASQHNPHDRPWRSHSQSSFTGQLPPHCSHAGWSWSCTQQQGPSPIRMSRVVWKSCSSSHSGCWRLSMSQTRLCSRSQIVAYIISPGTSPNTSCPTENCRCSGTWGGYSISACVSRTVGGYISPLIICARGKQQESWAATLGLSSVDSLSSDSRTLDHLHHSHSTNLGNLCHPVRREEFWAKTYLVF